MADFPPEVIQRAAEAVLSAQNASDDSPEWWEAEHVARAVLDAIAGPLGEHCAGKIAAHALRLHPRDDGDVPAAWHRHLGIAARIAARAFLADDDLVRLAAAEVAAGNFTACPALEDDDEPR